MNNKNLGSFKLKLINILINNRLYFGDKKLERSLSRYVVNKSSASFNDSVYLFSVSKQLKALMSVYFLLRDLKSKKRPVLFFGLNTKGLDLDNAKIVETLNRKIFGLCFSPYIYNESLKSFYEKCLDDYYQIAISGSKANKKSNKKLEKESQFFNFFFTNKNRLKTYFKTEVNGFFFNSWVSGSYSNYCFLSRFGKNDSLYKQHTMKTMSSFYSDYGISSPGVAIFFSRKGYENCFKELKEMGIPIICLVNSNESLNGVDYPLFGNNSNIKVNLFYIFAIKEALFSDSKTKFYNKTFHKRYSKS